MRGLSARVAFAGASGTGKSTLSTWICEEYDLPLNPVGSRSVSLEMGFASPYDVDKAGRRQEFQRLLVQKKRAWEDDHLRFVTDRTTLDNLAYTALHDPLGVDQDLIDACAAGMKRYTHLFICPVDSFCTPGGDPQRQPSLTYHRLFDAMIHGLLDLHLDDPPTMVWLASPDFEERKRVIRAILGNGGRVGLGGGFETLATAGYGAANGNSARGGNS